MKGKFCFRAMMALAAAILASPVAAAVFNPPFDLPEGKSGGKQSSCEAPPPPVKTFSAESVYEPGDQTHSTIDPEAKERYDAADATLRAFIRQGDHSATRY